MNVKKNRINQKPQKTLTTSHAMIWGKKHDLRETVNATHKQISNGMYKHSGRWNKENLGTNLLMEKEKNKYLWMLRMHHAVLWWSSPPKNGMISHLLGSCYVRPRHRKSCRWNPSQINPKIFFAQHMQCQHNACVRYHLGCCSRIRYWWKLVPSRHSINMQKFHQQKLSVINQRCSWWTISKCKLKLRSNIRQQDWWPS